MKRAMDLVTVPPDDELELRPLVKGAVQVSERKCMKCRKPSTLLVLYQNNAAVDVCDTCWARMPTKGKAVNVVRL